MFISACFTDLNFDNAKDANRRESATVFESQCINLLDTVTCSVTGDMLCRVMSAHCNKQ